MESESFAASPPGFRAGPVGWVLKVLRRFRPALKLAELLTDVRFVVRGDSMLPGFAEDQYILVSRLACLWDGLSRGDVVVLRHPVQQRRNYIKRIIGLPGEWVRIEGGRVLVDGQLLDETYLKEGVGGRGRCDERGGLRGRVSAIGSLDVPQEMVEEWHLGNDQYFVMGDNRTKSDDSRSFGPLHRRLIVGKAWIRYWPRDAWGFLR